MRKNVDEIRPIIVVDDVLTTGATLRNAILALNERKMTVLGAATACASAHQLLIR
ncbi:MAG: phosphoribosyltransferase family protein [Actinomycetota bacterium]